MAEMYTLSDVTRRSAEESKNYTDKQTSAIKDDLSQFQMGKIYIEAGGLQDSDGKTKNTRVDRLRTVIPFFCKHIKSIVIPSGYSFYIFYHRNDKTLISNTGWKSGTFNISSLPEEAYYITFVVRNNSNTSGNITGEIPYVFENTVVVYNILSVLDEDVKTLKTYAMTANASSLITDNDLNNARKTGFFILPYSTVYANCPVQSIRRLLEVYKMGADAYTVQKLTTYGTSASTYNVYIRYFADNAWNAWTLLTDKGMNENETFSFVRERSKMQTIPNVGTNLKIMSYNVANYNNDATTYINDEKLLNLKKVIMQSCADFIGLQEHRPALDSGSLQDSHEYLYKSIYPYKQGGSGTVIMSKKTIESGGYVVQSNPLIGSRYIQYMTTTIDNKKVLFCSAHPTWGGDGQTYINQRKAEYTEILKWVNHEVSLKNASGADTNAPTWDYCIICMDANSGTEADRVNLKSTAENYNFSLANGGYLGWLKTCKGATLGWSALDNILVSPNIFINNVMARTDLYTELYSDHVPLIVDLTLA